MQNLVSAKRSKTNNDPQRKSCVSQHCVYILMKRSVTGAYLQLWQFWAFQNQWLLTLNNESGGRFKISIPNYPVVGFWAAILQNARCIKMHKCHFFYWKFDMKILLLKINVKIFSLALVYSISNSISQIFME